MRKSIVAAGLLACVSTLAQAEEQKVVVKVPRITMEVAEKIAQAAVAECRKKGLQVTVSVVDRAGDPQIVLRDTLAPKISLTISQQKAATATWFNSPTSQMEDRFTKPFAVGKVDGLVFSAGGIPIHAGGVIVGGVGVSGAPSGTDDEACASAGLNAVAFDLESVSP